jgi:hypothetical protein
MPELTLAEAFRHCGPRVADPGEDRLRAAAMEVVYNHLRALARRRPDAERLDDVVPVVLLRLIQGGPRHDTVHDTDEKVDFYLRRALTNGMIDGCRRSSRCRSADDLWKDGALPEEKTTTPYDQADLSRARTAYAVAVSRLFGEVVRACSPSTREAIAIRRTVAEGRREFDDCVREASGEVNVQTRNAFYQRQSRAMRELARAVEAHILARALEAWDAHALQVVLRELKDAEAGWPLVEGA